MLQGELYTWGINDFGKWLYTLMKQTITKQNNHLLPYWAPSTIYTSQLTFLTIVFLCMCLFCCCAGQLGNGTTSYATEPQKVTEGLEGVVLADIAAGGWHSLALSTTGEVYVWGRGEYGRLGLGDKVGSSKLRPTKVSYIFILF